MKNRGLILFFSVLIALTCLYCLSFSFVTWKIGNDAKNYAKEQVSVDEVKKMANGDVMYEKHLLDSLTEAKEAEYLADKSVQKVYLGNTYKECKYKEVNLGLDLRGGMNVTLEISYPDVLKSLASHTENDPLFTAAFDATNVAYEKEKGDYVDLFVKNFNAQKEALSMPNALLSTYFGDRLSMKSATDAEIISQLKVETDEVIDRTFKILRTRIDRFGVAQPNIQRLQGSRILVELPGVKEPERVEELLQNTAKLEFWEVYTDVKNGQLIQQRFKAADAQVATGLQAKEQVAQVVADSTTTDSTAVDSAAVTPETNEVAEKVEKTTSILSLAMMNPEEHIGDPVIAYFKESNVKEVEQLLPAVERALGDKEVTFMWGEPVRDPQGALDGAYPLIPLKYKKFGAALSSEVIGGKRVVKSARQDIDEQNRAVVSMSMESDAAKEWRRITKDAAESLKATKRYTYIAIVLDGIVYSYPRVENEIPNGQSQISGNFTIDEAKDLATVLSSGNLEARINIVQSEVVGPTLGKESIRSGLLSFLLAFILVLVYVVLYYSRAGLVADIALCVNIFFIMGVLASIGAVLTLPGIAGIILTLGMAVDANVIIYERIREEIRAGKGIRLAIEEGYSNAYSAIIDSNITTLITAIVLYIFGSGPIQGFATTLIIGILSSLFTAIFISRLIFDKKVEKGVNYMFGNKYTLHAFENMNFQFIAKRKIFYIASGIMAVIMIASFATQGLSYGIDFTGGRNYVVLFDKDVKTNEVREAIAAEFGGNPEVKTFGGNDQVRITTNYKINENDQAVDRECEAKLYKALKPFYEKQDLTQDDFADQFDPRGIQSYQKVQPTIAQELLIDAVWAVIISLILIFIYIAIRFRNWQFGIGGIISLVHDTLFTIGLYSLLHKVMPFSMEVDQSFIAAVLTVIGYSINNVVIIFDRVRENLALYPKRDNYTNFNSAINSTMGRNINTFGTTIIVLLAIFLFGGEVIRGFVFAMLVGIISGAYSGIFISTPIAFDLLNKSKKINRAKTNITK